MNLSTEKYDEIVHLLYDAVAEPSAWPRCFATLGAAIGADAIHMLAIDKQHGSLSYSDGFNLSPESELAYLQKYGRIDPRAALMLARGAGEWTHCHEAFDDAYVARDPFYQEFLIPIGKRYLSGCKLVDDTRVSVIFAALRNLGTQPFGPDEIRFLDRLLPHLTRAVRMQRQHYTFSTKALVGHLLVDKLRQPAMLLTTDNGVVLANAAANTLLGSTGLIRIEAGKLQLPAACQARFQQECARLEGLARGEHGTADELSSYRAMTIMPAGATDARGAGRAAHRAADEPLYAFFTLLAPPKVGGAFGLRPLVLLLFYHPASAAPVDADLLGTTFNLTPVETRVSRLLAEGLSSKESAMRLGIQYDTVRKHLQSIYRKTATRRQPELMKLMLHLPLNALE